MPDNKYILLWLESPLQSWGFDSKFDRRDTLEFPTKSSILGLICSALGKQGEQRDFLKNISSSSLFTIAYYNGQLLPLIDYHMVGNGYSNDKWEQLRVPKTSEGKKPVGTGVKQTYRHYVQDVSYAVILEVPECYADEIIEGLQHPIFDIFLGRKCCIPTDFIYQGVFLDTSNAMEQAKIIAQSKNKKEQFRVVDGTDDRGETFIIKDVPICFGENKEYKSRYVTKIKAL